LISNHFMFNFKKVGVAAPQVNRSIQVLALQIKAYPELDMKQLPKSIFFNPVVKIETNKQIRLWEGCFSVPNLRGIVNRYNQCTITYKDENAQIKKMRATGTFST
jgi:peptide deformylase